MGRAVPPDASLGDRRRYTDRRLMHPGTAHRRHQSCQVSHLVLHGEVAASKFLNFLNFWGVGRIADDHG
jgi:hypothetical protein